MINFPVDDTPSAVVGSTGRSKPFLGDVNPQVHVEGLIIEPGSLDETRRSRALIRPSRHGLLDVAWQLRRWLARELVAVDGMSEAEIVSLAESRLERGHWTVTDAPARRGVTRCVPKEDAYVSLSSLLATDEAFAEAEPIVLTPRRQLSHRLPARPAEPCWPCKQAAATSRALRQAAARGAPFILDT